MTQRGQLISQAYKTANLLDEAELRKFPLPVLKQVRALLSRHKRSAHGAWEEPWELVNMIIQEKETEAK